MNEKQKLLLNLEIELSFVVDAIRFAKTEFDEQIAKMDYAYLTDRIAKLKGDYYESGSNINI